MGRERERKTETVQKFKENKISRRVIKGHSGKFSVQETCRVTIRQKSSMTRDNWVFQSLFALMLFFPTNFKLGRGDRVKEIMKI